jgi:putative ABC transport system permease protein
VLHVRTSGAPARVAAGIRSQIQALEASAPRVEVRAIDELVAPQFAPWRASAILLGVFGVVGLLLAAVGLYGVVAFLVARRTRELGIRLALGADRRDLLRLVLGDAGRLAGAGAAAGLLLAVFATRLFRSLLFGVGALDPLVYAATAALLAGVALAAAFVPARRATRVDAMEALRDT